MCRAESGQPTTSIAGQGPCNQSVTTNGPGSNPFEISASGGYMLAQSALPFANPGHLRGLTLQRLFAKVLEVGAPHLFMSSFNEFIGGRQPAAYPANTALNMGLPYDSQAKVVWVDTYASEFSRDIEPTVAGDRVWQVARSCVQMYKAGRTCTPHGAHPLPAADPDLCCTTADKDVFANIWSLTNSLTTDSLLTASAAEKNMLVGGGGWTENCNPVPGPSVFCVNPGLLDGREGPFILYNTAVADTATRPLYRCISTTGQHLFSIDSECEGLGKQESMLGHIAVSRGGEMLRALRRCLVNGRRTHALDLVCDSPDPAATETLGFVR
eukprot:TRINITY_DN7498_c0_g1_i1.p1 TRINITY_DN7498_c0_g1~~TRINITY_DN7498_c0_g1_i1.p1  ORF type:complete len:326 (-),score=45.81 TRINITY_DN7498_c0_g1_i1:227-1204(-)